MFVNQIHQKSEKAKEKIDMENSVSKARKSAGDLGSFHIFSKTRTKYNHHQQPEDRTLPPGQRVFDRDKLVVGHNLWLIEFCLRLIKVCQT